MPRIRPSSSALWGASLALLALLWGGALWMGARLPLLFSLPVWWPQGEFLLLADVFSWPYAFSLIALTLAVLLTAPARADRLPALWAANLPLLLVGLLAVFAGNPLTLAFTWALLDAVELALLLTQVRSSGARERLVAVFAARLGGTMLLLWVAAQGGALTFAAVPRPLNAVLLLAVGMRLGVLPLHVPFLREEPALWRGLGTTLRLVTPAASLGLLAHIARMGLPTPWVGPLSVFSVLAGLVGALGLWNAENELAGRPFWVLGLAALAIGASLRARPQASTAWGVLMVLDGGLLFLASLRERRALWIPLLAAGFFLGLPFTPGWTGAQGYLQPFNRASPAWMLVHALLLAGYVRHLWPGRPGRRPAGLERAAYLTGMTLLLGSAGLAARSLGGWQASGSMAHLPGLLLTGALLGRARRTTGRLPLPGRRVLPLLLRALSLDWLYRIAWRGYRLLSQGVTLLALALEGEGGLLWMFFLLLVALAVLSARFPGGLLP